MVIPHKISRLLWIPLLSCILGVPIISWVLHAALQDSLQSSFLFMTLLGQVMGIIGSQLFAFALLLSARLKSMEYFFGGLDRLYAIHHRVGVIAFTFLAVHPLILAFRFFGDGIESVMLFLIPTHKSLAQDFGIYALMLMVFLLFITFYGAIFSYQSLKKAHRFMGAAFFLAGLHVFLIPSSMNSDIVLKVSCLGMALLGLLAFSYRTLLGKYLVTRYSYIVSSVFSTGQGVTEVVLSPVKRIMHHIPGQFAMLSFTTSKVVTDEEHPFTISSAYDNGDVRFSIKTLGDYTSLLPGLTIGTQALLEGPFGEFSYHYGSSSQIWVAGGIGVTPFVSMAEDLLKQNTINVTIDFFYSVRSEKDAVYKELFTNVARKHSSFTFHCMPSDTSGYITGELLIKKISDATTRDIFICGPPPMMVSLTESLIELGVKSSHIHSEKFSLLK